jgi:hypothetical protein
MMLLSDAEFFDPGMGRTVRMRRGGERSTFFADNPFINEELLEQKKTDDSFQLVNIMYVRKCWNGVRYRQGVGKMYTTD